MSPAQTGAAMFSVSGDGALVYVPGSAGSAGELRLVWVDRQGQEEFLNVTAARYTRPRISPDGTRVAAEIVGDDGTSAIWVADAIRGTLSRVTAGEASSPVWTPDGQQVVFASLGDGEPGLFRQSFGWGHCRKGGSRSRRCSGWSQRCYSTNSCPRPRPRTTRRRPHGSARPKGPIIVRLAPATPKLN